MAEKLVVVGNGMAAGRALEELFRHDPDRYEVTVFNAEPRVNYNRIMLSPVLSGEKAYEDILIHDEDWYTANRVNLIRGEEVIAINREKQCVVTRAGTVADYDRLIVATGSLPFIIPVPGHDLPGVLSYRDLDDVEAMLAAAEKGGRAVVIGGGLLGLEAAAGLKARGMEVTVLHLMPTLMERQLDQSAGYLLQQAIEARGIEVITRANTHAITGEDHVTGVRLDDGREIEASLVVMAVGIKPNIGLAKDAGLETNRGLLVDDLMRTSDPAVYAVGECVEHRGACYGLVAPLYDMAKTLGAHLAEAGDRPYEGSVTATKLKVTGVDLYSAGDFAEGDDREEIVLRDASHSIYKRLVLRDNRIVGAVLYGDTADGPWFFQMIKDGTDISEMRETLIFGQGFAGAGPLDPTAAVAALPDDAEICGCNGVCKSSIVSAIVEGGHQTLDDVRAVTKASSSCGSCTGLVEQLLQVSLGDAYSRTAIQPMCGCTDLGHGEVRRLIVAKELKSIPAVMQELEWKTSCGCAKCRPALNYYLVATWPGEYVDDYQSRFINERVHANIQKDGTYSVVPRMWGGITNPAELRAIADVADKYAIPTVKVTGGQRIDLLGVKKEDLPAVWGDLNRAGMVSGHAYGKSLRTVKTCVGSEWCRFGTQASVSLGVQMEKFFWGSWTPHKVKMGVSGCPRNCAEATIKDIGIVCVDSGYEIHFAGAAGMEVKATILLCKVETEPQVLEYTAALLQLYREEAHYLDRMHKWLGRVGMEHVQQAVLQDAENRAALCARFIHSQETSQTDPWAERVAGLDAHEFTPLQGPKLEAVA